MDFLRFLPGFFSDLSFKTSRSAGGRHTEPAFFKKSSLDANVSSRTTLVKVYEDIYTMRTSAGRNIIGLVISYSSEASP